MPNYLDTLAYAKALDYLRSYGNSYLAAKACTELLADPSFLNASASSSSTHEHHVGAGGLVIHTAEVLRAALSAADRCPSNPSVDFGVLVTAAIYHDCEKRRDYTPIFQEDGSTKWAKMQHAKYIYHVASSYATWMDAAKRYGYNDTFAMAVGHCILAHHGRREYGSPVEPQTIEALLLHHADMVSAKYGIDR